MRENPYLHNNEIPLRFLTLLIVFFIIISTLFLINYSYSQQENPVVLPQPAMGEPLPGLTQEQVDQFEKGKKAFSTVLEGTGPIFNESRCIRCHTNPVGGALNEFEVESSVKRFGRRDGMNFDPLKDKGGSVLQRLGSCPDGGNELREVIPAEANVVAPRISIMTFGTGLIEAIPEQDILAHVNQPGTGGMANMVNVLEDPNGPLRVGRFGWKAQHATLLSFTADALNNEQGVTNELLPLEPQPNRPPGPSPCDDGVPDPDDKPNDQGQTSLKLIRDFMRFLAPPPQTPKSGMRGEKIFQDVGCVKCHMPSYTTGENLDIPALSKKQVKAYSDFLVHDMGEPDENGLGGDGIVLGQAGPREMRTAPLWGLTAHFGLMHNNIGPNPEFSSPLPLRDIDIQAFEKTVIAGHNRPGSEAQVSAANFMQLSQNQKQDLLAFFRSLGRREFDFIFAVQAGEITLEDYRAIYDCFRSPHQNILPDDPCGIADIDQDGILGLVDAQSFVNAVKISCGCLNEDTSCLYFCQDKPDWLKDCQHDGKDDIVQILQEGLEDANKDTIPDECKYEINLINTYTFVNRCDGKLQFSTTVASDNLPKDAQIEFFYSFKGPGQGTPFGDAFYIDLLEPQSYGVMSLFQYSWGVRDGKIEIPPGATQFSFQAGILNGGTNSKKSLVHIVDIKWPEPLPPSKFIRGNANKSATNQNDTVDLSDAIFILNWLFVNGSKPDCRDSADVNDDGRLDISDAIYLLRHLFVDPQKVIPSPFPGYGVDPTPDNLGCWEENFC